jgi:predicted dehydrogenase
MLRVAIVGCGLISGQHIRAYARFPERARIVVCCDPVRERAEAAAELAGGARVVTDLAEVLADPEVQSVDLLTPHHLHIAGVEAAAEAGKHILCQKPLARTLEECDRMIAAAERAGVHLFYGEISRTSPVAVAAKRAVDEGRIGRIVGLQGTYSNWQTGSYLQTAWRYDPALSGGGQLLDGGVHVLDYLMHLGGPIAGVMCHTTRFREELGGEDTATLSLRFEGGHLGTLLSSHASATWMPEAYAVAFGTDALLVLGGRHGALTLHPRGGGEPEVLAVERGDSFASMIEAYLGVVLDGNPSPSPARLGRETLEVVLAAYQSAEERREVSITRAAGSA